MIVINPFYEPSCGILINYPLLQDALAVERERRLLRRRAIADAFADEPEVFYMI